MCPKCTAVLFLASLKLNENHGKCKPHQVLAGSAVLVHLRVHLSYHISLHARRICCPLLIPVVISRLVAHDLSSAGPDSSLHVAGGTISASVPGHKWGHASCHAGVGVGGSCEHLGQDMGNRQRLHGQQREECLGIPSARKKCFLSLDKLSSTEMPEVLC